MNRTLSVLSLGLAPALLIGFAVSASAAEPEAEDAAEKKGLQTLVLSVKPEEALRQRTVSRGPESAGGDVMSYETLEAARSALEKEVRVSTTCSASLRGAQAPSPPSDCTKLKLQEQLLQERRKFRYLKKWVGYCTTGKARARGYCLGDQGKLITLRTDVDDLKKALDDVLEAENLREPFVAELVPGLAFATSAADSGDGTSTNPAAFLRWKSNPFGMGFDADRDLDFTVGGRFGYMPALTLVTPADAADEPTPPEGESPSVAYQEALGWDIRLNVRRHFGEHAQLVASGGGGQLILNTNSSIGEFDGKDALFTTIPNGVGRAAFFWDAQLAVRYFKSNRETTAEQQGTNPGLELSFGYRKDTRFQADPASVVQYDKPEDRWVFRFLLSDLRVVDRRTREAPTFTLTLGVEHEFGVGGNGVPSVTRIFLAGDIAILRALNGNR